jgi:hypothetical protein
VCSAETRDLRRDDAVSEAWSDDVEAGDVIDDIVEKVHLPGVLWLRGLRIGVVRGKKPRE